MRKPAWITLLFCLFGGLTACGPTPANLAVATAMPTAAPAAAQPNPDVSSAATASPVPTAAPLSQYQVPVYYDPAYISIINASKLEDALYIYSGQPQNSWNTLVRTFNSHYPWIEVKTVEIDPAEIFQRYYQDLRDNQRSADLLISADPNGWYEFSFADDLFYHSQEETQVPDWSKSTLGTYTVFCEPMVLIYNQKLVPTPPQSMAELVTLLNNDPDGFRGQIVTYDAGKNAIGLAVNGFWLNVKKQAGWDLLTSIGTSQPKVLTSPQAIIDTVASGEAKIGYFVPLEMVLAREGDSPQLSWTYLADGQPVLLPGMMIAQQAVSPNSARLMVDFLLSQEGQYTLSLGGLMPYRSDIADAVPLHFDQLSSQLGDANLIRGALDDRLTSASILINLVEKWKVALGQ